MESFNINRFGKTLRWYLSVNFRNLMIRMMGYTIFVFLGGMLMWRVMTNIEYAQSFSIFIFISLVVGLSTIFSDMNKKASRESLLMLPASNLEKFLAAVFYVTVVWALGVFLSFAIGDTLRMTVRSLSYGDEWVSGIPALMDAMTPIDFQRIWLPETVFYVLLTVFTHSMYILGGTWLRKYAFVVTTLVLIAIPVLLQYVFIEPGKHLNLFVTYNGVRSVNPLGYVLDVAFVILSCLNYWASFHIFKHFELITNKWTNYDILKR